MQAHNNGYDLSKNANINKKLPWFACKIKKWKKICTGGQTHQFFGYISLCDVCVVCRQVNRTHRSCIRVFVAIHSGQRIHFHPSRTSSYANNSICLFRLIHGKQNPVQWAWLSSMGLFMYEKKKVVAKDSAEHEPCTYHILFLSRTFRWPPRLCQFIGNIIIPRSCLGHMPQT